MSKHENIEKALCKELEQLDQKVAGGNMTMDDLHKIDVITHALKSLATYDAMSEEWEGGMSGYDGQSSRRGRSMTTGRYISRDPRQPDPMGGEFGYPFPDGYSGRYYPPRW